MNKQEAVDILVAHRDVLRARGVRHAALFGSVARGEARPCSDVDILIELEPSFALGVFEYVGLKMFISELFAVRVDVVDLDALKPYVRPSAERDAIYAF